VSFRRIAIVLIAAAVAAGCGGSSASSKERVSACVDKYPDATKADCQEWDDAKQLDDDGTHEGHENMG
jgi:ABC-type glycerol-3-phosphate transport system substrate-binding protein